MNKSEGSSDKSILEKNVISYLHEHRQCVVGTSLNDIPFVAKVYRPAPRKPRLACPLK